MSRKRQFSSERLQLTKSNLSHSRNYLNSSRYNNTPLQKYQIATPQSNKNQLNNKNASNSSNKNLSDSKLSRKSSSSDYICVGCFNNNLAADRKKQFRNQLLKEKEQQKLNNQVLINQQHQMYIKHSQHQKQITQVKTYNKQLIDHKRQQKLKQQSLQQQINAKQRQQQKKIQKQEKSKYQEKKAVIEKYKTAIKQQIEQKYQKSHLVSPFVIKEPFNDIFGRTEDSYFNQKAQKQHFYRQELLKQIKDREQTIKKQSTQMKKAENTGLGLTEAAYERQLQRKNKINDQQQQMLEEAKRKKKIHEKQLYQEQVRQQKVQQQKIRQQRAQQQQQRRFKQQKQKKTYAYLNELKHQIQSRKRKLQEERQLNYFVNTSMQFQEKQPQRKPCKSCDKKFPKTFLTKIN